MSKITILAGDFPVGMGLFTFRNFTLPGDENHYLCETVSVNQISFLNSADDELLLLMDTDNNTKDFIENAREDQRFFMAKLKDGRKFVAATEQKTFSKILKSIEREAGLSVDDLAINTPSAA